MWVVVVVVVVVPLLPMAATPPLPLVPVIVVVIIIVSMRGSLIVHRVTAAALAIAVSPHLIAMSIVVVVAAVRTVPIVIVGMTGGAGSG